MNLWSPLSIDLWLPGRMDFYWIDVMCYFDVFPNFSLGKIRVFIWQFWRNKLYCDTRLLQVDPNTGVAMYESDDIIKYLADTYGVYSTYLPFTFALQGCSY
jgi:hypothetical protein